jgi:VWFA-related protein
MPLLVALALVAPAGAFGQQSERLEPSQEGAQEDAPAVELKTTLVEVPVVVSEPGGRYVVDLAESDFKIFENGEPRDISFFAAVDEPFDVALVLDTSGSTRDKLERIKDAALAFVGQLRPRDRVAVVSFEDEVNVLVPLTRDRAMIRSAISRLSSGEYTQVYEAVHTVAEDVFADAANRKAAILFTDGVDTASAIATFEDSLGEISRRQVIVYPIRYNTMPDVEARLGLENGASDDEGRPRKVATYDETRRKLADVYHVADAYLYEIASRTGGVLHRADRLEDLPTAFARIADELRHQYLLGYYPVSDDADAERRITVTVSRAGLDVRSRESYRSSDRLRPRAH